MIGILTAMEMEGRAIEKRMEHVKESNEAGCTFLTGTLAGKETMVCIGGVGKALAAMACTLLAVKAKPEYILNVGVAGGLDPRLHVMDVVLSDAVVQTDYDTSPLDGPEGFAKRYAPDPELMKRGERASQSLSLSALSGGIASSDCFISREEDVARLESLFPECVCAEMEAGAMAAVCSAMDIPFFVIRSISDVVGHNDNPMEFSKFAALASEQAADFAQAFVA